MPRVKIVDATIELKGWTNQSEFKRKGQLVDEHGRSVGNNYNGKFYKIISKKEHLYSCPERMGRCLLGIFLIVASLGLGVCSKTIRNLLTQAKSRLYLVTPSDDTRRFTEYGELYYVDPVIVGASFKYQNEEVCWGIIKTDGVEKLHPLIGKDKKFKIFNNRALDALLFQAQQKPSSQFSPEPLIKKILNHPLNTSIVEKDFIEFLISHNYLDTLNAVSTLEVLEIIQSKKYPVDLQKIPLLIKWVKDKGDSWGRREINVKIVKLILELEPRAIHQIKNEAADLLVDCIFRNSQEEAQLLLAAMESQQIAFSPELVWIKRAITNDTNFTQKEFSELSDQQKQQLYFIANAFLHEQFVTKLDAFGMHQKPLFFPGAYIFAANMNFLAVKKTMHDFLVTLKQQNLLMSASQFAKEDQAKYMSKGDNLGRLFGRNFVEKLAKEHGCKYIKAPKKIVVVDKDKQAIDLRLSNLDLISRDITVYAEKVEYVERNFKLEEALEFALMIEKTGYNDFAGQNFIVAKDGIYFIDTELKDFAPHKPNFSAIFSLQEQLEPQDVEPFLKVVKARKEQFEKDKTMATRVEQYRETFKDPSKDLADGICYKHFVFELAQL